MKTETPKTTASPPTEPRTGPIIQSSDLGCTWTGNGWQSENIQRTIYMKQKHLKDKMLYHILQNVYLPPNFFLSFDYSRFAEE